MLLSGRRLVQSDRTELQGRAPAAAGLEHTRPARLSSPGCQQCGRHGSSRSVTDEAPQKSQGTVPSSWAGWCMLWPRSVTAPPCTALRRALGSSVQELALLLAGLEAGGSRAPSASPRCRACCGQAVARVGGLTALCCAGAGAAAGQAEGRGQPGPDLHPDVAHAGPAGGVPQPARLHLSAPGRLHQA